MRGAVPDAVLALGCDFSISIGLAQLGGPCVLIARAGGLLGERKVE